MDYNRNDSDGNMQKTFIAQPVVKITETSGLTSILKIIWFVSLFNSLFLVYLPYYEGNKGEQILSDSIGPSKDINADVLLIENKDVTIFLEEDERSLDTESLKIDIVDPQKKEYSFEKKFSPGLGTNGKWDATRDSFSFIPKASGVHHLKISNATFDTDVRIVSGMANLYQQPFFVITLFVSFVTMLTGIFSLRKKAIMESMYSGKIVNDIICFCLALPISWILVHSVARW
jgi:hypothetical protein